MPSEQHTISPEDFRAGIFDLDGVITDTASVHFASWKEVFDDFLGEYSDQDSFSEEDYRDRVDGKPRAEGIDSFLASRGIDGADVAELAARKNDAFHRHLREDGVDVFEDAVGFVRHVRRAGLATAIVSSSKNCQRVLEAAGLEELFDQRVDGHDLAELRGKPAPDMFIEAARRLGVEPRETFMVEDAIAGVEAGRAGEFGLVIGIARGSGANELRKHGADLVIDDFHDLGVIDMESALPNALDCLDEMLSRVRQGVTAVFLDFDGTLAPIVSRPEDAAISEEMRASVERLAEICHVAIVSGRDLADVKERVGLPNVAYAGSHGFEIETVDGECLNPTAADDFLPVLDEAEEELRDRLSDIEGAQIERKRYSLAVHYRRVDDDRVADVREAVEEVLDDVERMRLTHGKKVLDLQPDLDWHKGRAIETILEALDLDRPMVTPFYIGDDVTDEDAFRTLSGRGITIAVRDDHRSTDADYELESPADVRRFLEALADGLHAD